jgi:hypothetical protein
MKVEVVKEIPKKPTVYARHMEVGELGLVVANGVLCGGCVGYIVLRAFDSLVALNNPKATWRIHAGPDFEIEVLKPGTQVVLTVE